jgi:hypothetical protein
MSTNVHVSVRNGDVVPINNSSGDNRGGVIDVYYGGAYEGSDTLLGSELSNPDLNYNPQTVYHSFHDFTIPTIGAAYEYDNSLTGPFEEFDYSSTFFVQTPNFSGNDTTYNTQYFKNYYAYDDGSAELAYGPTGIQSRLAVRYDAYEADSLIGVKIHFVPSVTDVSNNLFYLCVWDDGDGKPGALIYQDSTFFPRSPIYEYDRNIFTTYYFEDTMKVAVGETFYVGWRQVDPEPLGVGLDMNIVNNDKTFYSIDSENSWPNSTYEGSVMMRPIFSTSYDPFLGIREESKEEIVSAAILYPNPTTALVNIQVDNANYNGVEVYNLQGLLVDHTINKQVDLSNHPAGMYIFKLKGSPQIYKVIKK